MLLSADQIVGGFSLLAALCQGVIAYVPHTPTVALCLVFAGMSWIAILSTINTAIQLSVPPWVKARAFGTYHTVRRHELGAVRGARPARGRDRADPGKLPQFHHG
jgi:hypothetical protein